ncbi:MAG: hypothetical protein R2685_08110 [Candidatus Nitrosocosmicus sp.]|nr:hypothetical protein [Candidatus Nitrosocosmicus sp.]
MSYSSIAYQATKNNSSNVNERTTSQARVYQSEFIDFVYNEVIKAVKNRSKDDLPRFDLDSKAILINAQKLADEKLRKGVLI